MNRIPFQLPDVGLREIKGAVYLDETFLVIEIENALFGEYDKDHEIVKVEPAALQDVRLDRGIFKDRIALRPKSTTLLESIPGEHGFEVLLPVWRTHRSRAQELVRELRLRLI